MKVPVVQGQVHLVVEAIVLPLRLAPRRHVRPLSAKCKMMQFGCGAVASAAVIEIMRDVARRDILASRMALVASMSLLLPAACGFHTAISPATNAPSRTAPVLSAATAIADEMCNLDNVACTYDPADIDARFADEPFAVAGRVAEVTAALARVKLAGDDGGATLRLELGKLGPVFCKVGQTLATRPDIIGLETSRNLGQLQDAMAPEAAGPEVAMATLGDALGDVTLKLTNISAAPIAAASLAEVYRANTVADGTSVAVKIQRPGLERKVRSPK